jgi:group I intron endonuclease
MNNLKPEEKDNVNTTIEIVNPQKENEWKDTGKISGIYKIINKLDGKYYVGSDSDINCNTRWNDHKSKLKRNKHYNTHLQNSWNKYGGENFEYKVVEIFKNISSENLSDIEQLYLNESKLEKNKCYNIIYGVRNYRRISHKNIKKTPDEIRKQWRDRSKRYYVKHKEKCNQKYMERYWLKKEMNNKSSLL